MLRLAFDFVLVGVSLRSGNPGNEASLRAKEAGTVEIRTIKL